jgi:fumarylacetoacetase
MSLDATHDPALRSWVPSAQADDTDFPIQNLPYGRLRRTGSGEPWRIGVAIGDQVLDLAAARATGGWTPDVADALAPLAAGDLNAFMTLGPPAWQAVRSALSAALAEGSPHEVALRSALVPMSAVELSMPFRVGDYTDFYTGIHHARTVGALFRPDQPLMPNYRWVPIGYHGRASSIGVGPQAVRRPRGQQAPVGESPVPRFGPSQRLDYELELGAVVGCGNALGEPVPVGRAASHLFGLVLLNDWSARDLQAWEYQPLGPFLAKNFATTVSPWVVTMAALEPFRVPFVRPEGDPQPLPYLDDADDRARGALDIALEVRLHTAAMRARGEPAVRLSASNATDAYWTLAQLVAHHTVGGCNLQPGDLLGTGTLSGPLPGQGGSLLELTVGGRQRIDLPGGETRGFLEDGDTVELHARCQRPGVRALGFGLCAGTVLPAG